MNELECCTFGKSFWGPIKRSGGSIGIHCFSEELQAFVDEIANEDDYRLWLCLRRAV